MKYKVTHTTSYHYTDPAPVCHNEVHLTPRNGPWQQCEQHRLQIRPEPSAQSNRLDYFGNRINCFSIHEGHRKLIVTALSKVEVFPRESPEPRNCPSWESIRDRVREDRTRQGLEAYQFAFDSPRAKHSAELRDYVAPLLKPGRPLLDAALELTNRVYTEFRYDTAATSVSTPLPAVFSMKRGVCQDFAHVMIGCLRAFGLPVRYVSGYLRTLPPPGMPRLVGADASHAWVSVWCGELGWIDLDPTNDVIPCTDHITLAWGRDYGDVSPIKGVFFGGGQHVMSVAVDVEPLEENP